MGVEVVLPMVTRKKAKKRPVNTDPNFPPLPDIGREVEERTIAAHKAFIAKTEMEIEGTEAECFHALKMRVNMLAEEYKEGGLPELAEDLRLCLLVSLCHAVGPNGNGMNCEIFMRQVLQHRSNLGRIREQQMARMKFMGQDPGTVIQQLEKIAEGSIAHVQG
jgi:hypothetical protein